MSDDSDGDSDTASRGDGGIQRAGEGGFNWRHGPAKLWYDMMNLPEDYTEALDYGFKLKRTSGSDQREDNKVPNYNVENGSRSNVFPPEAFHLVVQKEWEKDVIWDSSDIKEYGRPEAASNYVAYTQNGTWYSKLRVENPELVHGRWEDEVIWDAEQMDKLPAPKVLSLDPNDENIVLSVPDDTDVDHRDPLSLLQNPQKKGKGKLKEYMEKNNKSKSILCNAGLIKVPSPVPVPLSPMNDHNEKKDPYNISNDEYYLPKISQQSTSVSGEPLHHLLHSIPVQQLQAPFIPTQMGVQDLRNFHRPKFVPTTTGSLPLPIFSLTKHILQKAKQRSLQGNIFFMRTPEDLSGKDGEILLVEYSEQHPPLLSQVGMCSKIINYYSNKTLLPNPESPQFQLAVPVPNYGDAIPVYSSSSPFLGVLHPGQVVSSLENNLYRAPIYEHAIPDTDFLLIHTSSGGYHIREVDALFTAGQQCPLYEVPHPNSKRAHDFQRDILQVFVYRLFQKGNRIRIDDVRRAFPDYCDSTLRRRLHVCADFQRGGINGWWELKPNFRLPTEEEIRAILSPEECCAFFSLIAAEQRLSDGGYRKKTQLPLASEVEEIIDLENLDEDEMKLVDDELKLAPWNTTRSYIEAKQGKCLLQLPRSRSFDDSTDPVYEGFTYVSVSKKMANGLLQQEQQMSDAQNKKMPVFVKGTDADLRSITMKDATGLLRKFGVPEEEIKKLSRWEVIDCLRTISTEKAKRKTGGGDNDNDVTKFSRKPHYPLSEQLEHYKLACQKIFDLQNKALSSSEILSSDAESADEDESDSELLELEAMGKKIENMLQQTGSGSQCQGRALRSSSSKMSVNKPKTLKIHRTYKRQDGSEYTITETVRNPKVIEVYTNFRRLKDDEIIKQLRLSMPLLESKSIPTPKKPPVKPKEPTKPKVPAKPKALAKPKEPKVPAKPNPKAPAEPKAPPAIPKKFKVQVKEKSAKKEKKIASDTSRRGKLKPGLKIKCGACGQVGHMKTNLICPLNKKHQQNRVVPPLILKLVKDEPLDEADIGHGPPVNLNLNMNPAPENGRKRTWDNADINHNDYNYDYNHNYSYNSCKYMIIKNEESDSDDEPNPVKKLLLRLVPVYPV